MIEAAFHCAVCNKVAATLQITDDNRFIQRDFWGESTEWVSAAHAFVLEAALNQENVEALYRNNSLWAPFYCPECRAIYCYAHWRTEIQFDDDFPGWYDCTYGTCPAGHRRIVDD